MTSPPDAWQRWRPWLPDALAGALVASSACGSSRNDLVVTDRFGERSWSSLGVASRSRSPVPLPGARAGRRLARPAASTSSPAPVPWSSRCRSPSSPSAAPAGAAPPSSGSAALSIPVGGRIAVALRSTPASSTTRSATAGIRVLARRALRRHERLAAPGRHARHRAADGALAAGARAPLLGPGRRPHERSQVEAEAERDQAAEIARLRDEQTRLAHDVHDVVGHSLAVILAQAESASSSTTTTPAALKQTMANIATSARGSLEDVRQVLAATSGTAAPAARQADLDSLVDGVRASGHDVESTVVGRPSRCRPSSRWWRTGCCRRCSPTRSSTAGATGRCWSSGTGRATCGSRCRTTSRTTVDETQPITVGAEPVDAGGQGLDGMRRRLESVGGRLDVRRRSDPPTFTATAWVPVDGRPGERPTIRVLLVDDQDLFREGVRGHRRRPGGHRGRRLGRRRRRGGAAGRRARARRRADGHPDARDGRRRGDPADLPARPGRRGASVRCG